MNKDKTKIQTSVILDDFFKIKNKVDYEKTLIKMTVAKKIYDGMIKNKLNKIEFSYIMKKQPSIITRWLSGNHNFTIESLVEIQDALKIKLI